MKRTRDHITIEGLVVIANHGVFEFERSAGQPFIIDVTAWLDTARSASNDDLSRTVHYGELADAVAAAVAHDPVDLIETLAERIASVALSFALIEKVRVTVHKPEAPIAHTFRDISVTIVRWRS